MELTYNDYMEFKGDFVGDNPDDINTNSFVYDLYRNGTDVHFIFENVKELADCGKFIIDCNNDEKEEMKDLDISEHTFTDLELFLAMNIMIRTEQNEIIFNQDNYTIKN